MKALISILCASVLFFSCLKEELPIPVPKPGDIESVQISMEATYINQVFFSFNSGDVISTNLRTDWDLGFGSDEDNSIILNSSTLMRVAVSSEKEFDKVLDTVGLKWLYDAASGNPDSLAFHDWESGNFIYIVDRGYDEKGISRGLYKIKISGIEDGIYQMQYASLEELTVSEILIEKNDRLSFVPFSFDGGGNTDVFFPDKDLWDIVFTQYTEFLDDGSELIPYLVTGVLLNRNNTFAALTEDVSFEDITLEYASQLVLKNKLNSIGYGWKEFNFETSIYEVFLTKIYIVQSNSGILYKMRFMDFYSDTGEKGFPKFEYQRL